MFVKVLFITDISFSHLTAPTVTGLWVIDAPFWVICSLVTSLWEPMLENMACIGFEHHYLLLLLSQQKPK